MIGDHDFLGSSSLTPIALLPKRANGLGLKAHTETDTESAAESDDEEFLPDARSPDQQRAYTALHGNGGFSSWERIIKSAEPESRPEILRNGLLELYPLAESAAVRHVEISDWAYRIGILYNICDADELRRIIAEAKTSGARAASSPIAVPVISDRLRPLDLEQFLQLSIKPREMLLDPILPEKGLAMLYAARGTGKTHVALGIGFGVATGTRISEMERSETSPRAVDRR